MVKVWGWCRSGGGRALGVVGVWVVRGLGVVRVWGSRVVRV